MNCPRKESGQALKNPLLLPRSPSSRRRGGSTGQALVVILLVSAIGLTLGLSLASRATRDTGVVTDIEESARAFSAAEAGLQESAQNIGDLGFTSSETVGGATYDVEIKSVGNSSDPYKFPGKLTDNQPISIWLIEQDDTGSFDGDSIDVCWGGDDPDEAEAALETTLYYRTAGAGGEYRLARGVYNPSISIVSGGDSATLASGGSGCGGEFKYRQEVRFSDLNSVNSYVSGDTLLLLKIRPITSPSGGGTSLAVDPRGSNLPSQGEEHVSTGETTGGQMTKIRQFISHPAPPEIFDAVIYSNTTIEK